MNIVEPESVGLSTPRLQRLANAMQQCIDGGALAGMITVIARRGVVAHLGVYGMMDLARAAPMTTDAIFRLFSMTKPVTSLAALMLCEEGILHLQDPVQEYLPEFANLKVWQGEGAPLSQLERPVTLCDLLTHTSGLGYGLDTSTPVNALYQQKAMLRMDEPMAEKITRMAQLPLHHQPGRAYTYSLSTDVIGRVIEVVSGMPLDSFLKQRIFEPLGMHDTDFYVPAEKLPRLATLYTAAPQGGLVDVATLPGDGAQFPFGAWTDKSFKPAFLSGGGGLVSTTTDYLRFAWMLRNHGALDGARLVSRKTIELMTAPQLRPELSPLPGVNIGLGVTVLTNPAQAQMLGSPGAYGGSGASHCEFWIDPQEDMITLLMTQYIHYKPLPVGMTFRALAAASIED